MLSAPSLVTAVALTIAMQYCVLFAGSIMQNCSHSELNANVPKAKQHAAPKVKAIR